MTTYASLFSGAGGFDLGAQLQRLTPTLINDQDYERINTIRCSDIPSDNAMVGTIESFLHYGMQEWTADIVIGGPPCQGYSVAGKMDPNDPRSGQVFNFLKAVEQMRPAGFVMENVASLAKPRWSLVLEKIQEEARRIGYDTYIHVLNAADYLVPQNRKRTFIFGVPIGGNPVYPLEPNCFVINARDALDTMRLQKAKRDKNVPDMAAKARIILAKRPVLRKSPYAGRFFNGNGRVFNLDAPAPTIPAIAGGNNTPIYDVWQYVNNEAPWIVDYHRHLMNGGEPLTEIPESVAMKRLSFRECAAIQGFPFNYPFRGTVANRWSQIGDAVPPLLGDTVIYMLLCALGLA